MYVVILSYLMLSYSIALAYAYASLVCELSFISYINTHIIKLKEGV